MPLSRAATPARCTALKMPESMLVLTRPRASMATGLPTAQPIRQPVMLKILDSEPNSTATSMAPGTWRTDGATKPS